jgi:hypothetical protein
MRFRWRAPLFGFVALGGMGWVLVRKMLFDIPVYLGDHAARWFIVVAYGFFATITVGVMVRQAMQDPDDFP